MPEPTTGQTVGRYILYDEIASGGMASVHMARLIGPAGFSRVVAAKRLHAAYAKDPDFVFMLLDEARLASRVRHPNVIAILDVVAAEGELLLVMEYMPGETLARLLRAAHRAGSMPPPDVVVAILIDMLRGLHAAHEARAASGEPLRIVHRDVSPQNVLVGTDGMARLLDFGVAKAVSRVQTTDEGQLKGKLGYIAPEQLSGAEVDRRADLFAAAIVAWESIAGRRLFIADDPVSTLARIIHAEIPSLAASGCDIPEALDRVIAHGLERDPEQRFQTAEEMARELELALQPAPRERVIEWLVQLAGDRLEQRQETMRRIETESTELGVVEVPVDLSAAGQSGNFAAIRTTLGAGGYGERPAASSFEEPGTFSSPLATNSIAPQAQRRFGARSAFLLTLGALVIGALVGAQLFGRTQSIGSQSRSASSEPIPSAPSVPSASTANAPDAAPAAAPSAEPARTTTATHGPAPRVRASRRAPARSAAAASAAPEQKPPPAKPAPAPVDPLADQR
jgi:eukaryotic-like serine/threonine-protein kinase